MVRRSQNAFRAPPALAGIDTAWDARAERVITPDGKALRQAKMSIRRRWRGHDATLRRRCRLRLIVFTSILTRSDKLSEGDPP